MAQLIQWIWDHSHIPVLAAGAVFTFFWLLPFRKRLRFSVVSALALALLHVTVGLLSVSLFAAIENPGSYKLGMVSIFGGTFFMPLAYFCGAKWTKRDTRAVFDIFTICLLFTLMCSRFGCLAGGCCQGRLLSLSWVNGPRWPTRELEILFYVVFMLYYGPKVLKGKTKGELYPIYMMAYGVFRFITETLRESDTHTLFHLSHVWAVIAFGIGFSIYVEQKKRGGKSK